MKDLDLALDQISNIRAQIAANTRFLGFSPEFNVMLGGVAVVIALVQIFSGSMEDNTRYIAVWSVFLLTSGGMGTLDAVSRARREHGRMADAILGALLQKVAPFVLAMAVLSWVIWRFSAGNVWLLPGMWQVLLGLLGFATLASLPRPMVWVAGWYFVCGITVLTVAAQTQLLSPWMMGLPFGIGQLGVGLALAGSRGQTGV